MYNHYVRKESTMKRGIFLQTASFILGLICILYFLGIELFTGHGTRFYFIWLILGVIFCLFSFAYGKGWIGELPSVIRKTAMVCFMAGLLLFLFVEGLILSGFNAKGTDNLDYIVVLGAQLKENGPSQVLKMRLDKAYDYLMDNPGTKVIVSGGKGKNEPDTEANGMFRYLVERGIDENRIIREDESCNTVQNILYSSEYLNKEKDKVGIISNNFHIFRAVSIAKANGYEKVWGISAPSYAYLQPNNMMREFFGIIKDFLYGNL